MFPSGILPDAMHRTVRRITHHRPGLSNKLLIVFDKWREKHHGKVLSHCQVSVCVAVCLWYGIFTFKSVTEEGLYWVCEGFGGLKIGLWEDLKIEIGGRFKAQRCEKISIRTQRSTTKVCVQWLTFHRNFRNCPSNAPSISGRALFCLK